MSRPNPNKPNPVIQRLYREAEEAWGLQDYQKSISLIEQATRKEPTNPSHWLSLARACGKRYDYPAAERYIEKAVKISQDRARILAEAGQICLEFDSIEMAIGCYQQASEKKGVSVNALMTLADIYIRDKRLDEAADLVARAAQMDRKAPLVLFEGAVLRRLRGATAEAESLFRELLANPACSGSARVRAFYELASIQDSEGRFDEAMGTLLEAKALLRPTAGPYAATIHHMQSRAQEMERSITSTVLDRWRADAAKLQPLRRIALLCGHPRSGTTLLEQVLDGHSDVISAEETKMMHDDAYLPLIRDFPEGTSILEALDSVPPSLICHARDNYFQCMELFLRRKIGSHLLVDKNPALNLMIPMVVRIFPETKFLVALRDPRDVVTSCFLQALPLTPISSAYLSLEGTVNQYANVMGFWLEMLPRMGDQWMYVRYEEMVEDLPSVARSVLEFLDVAFEDNVLKFYEHASSKRVRSPSYADVRKPLYRTAVGRWRNYQKYLEPYLARLQRFLDAFSYH
jgi:tetratricopeptide (TPR) repeat protein